jgi:hypothetical protein
MHAEMWRLPPPLDCPANSAQGQHCRVFATEWSSIVPPPTPPLHLLLQQRPPLTATSATATKITTHQIHRHKPAQASTAFQCGLWSLPHSGKNIVVLTAEQQTLHHYLPYHNHCYYHDYQYCHFVGTTTTTPTTPTRYYDCYYHHSTTTAISHPCQQHSSAGSGRCPTG